MDIGESFKQKKIEFIGEAIRPFKQPPRAETISKISAVGEPSPFKKLYGYSEKGPISRKLQPLLPERSLTVLPPSFEYFDIKTGTRVKIKKLAPGIFEKTVYEPIKPQEKTTFEVYDKLKKRGVKFTFDPLSKKVAKEFTYKPSKTSIPKTDIESQFGRQALLLEKPKKKLVKPKLQSQKIISVYTTPSKQLAEPKSKYDQVLAPQRLLLPTIPQVAKEIPSPITKFGTRFAGSRFFGIVPKVETRQRVKQGTTFKQKLALAVSPAISQKQQFRQFVTKRISQKAIQKPAQQIRLDTQIKLKAKQAQKIGLIVETLPKIKTIQKQKLVVDTLPKIKQELRLGGKSILETRQKFKTGDFDYFKQPSKIFKGGFIPKISKRAFVGVPSVSVALGGKGFKLTAKQIAGKQTISPFQIRSLPKFRRKILY